jgi:Uncharacterized protein conserved in bacteria (DUF2320).
MSVPRSGFLSSHRGVGAALAALCTTVPAHALLRFNDGRDQVYVTAYVGAGYDSNVYTSSSNQDDFIISGGVGLEYARKAGLIGVNGSLGWDLGQFSNLSSENFINPSASLEFSKGTGRTTGSIQFNGRRATMPDPTVGLRTDSWNYGVNLNLRYPVVDRYSIAGNIGWSRVDYSDESGLFSDLDSYTFGADLFYSWRSDRDLLAGYNYKQSDAQFASSSIDHSVYVGVAGRIVSKLSGSARVGVTHHTMRYPGAIPDSSTNGLYASVSGTWPASQKATYTLALSQNFSTTSSNFETRTTAADLTGQFSHTVKFSTNATLGAGYTEFLSGYAKGASGPTSGFNGQERNDHYITIGCGARYALNSHISFGINYNYYQSWSSLSSYAFARHSFGINMSTRW